MFSERDHLNVLIIEDNIGDFILIQEYFREEIHKPTLTHTPTFADARKVLATNHDFDAILLDLTLPDARGEKLVDDMILIAGNIPVIVLTGYADKEFGIKTLSRGISDYLLKDELTPSVLAKSVIYGMERKRIGIELKEAEEQRKKYENSLTQAIITAQEKERMEIGAELHDNINQILTASKMNLRLARDEVSKEKTTEWIQNANNYIEIALDELRRLSHRLAPRSFKENSLIEAFRNLIQSINPEQKLKTEIIQKNYDDKRLSEDLKLNLFRILQEQLKNIINYSQATLIAVHISITNDTLSMRIIDNGVGFNSSSAAGGIGLNNIKQRTELFHGKFLLKTAPGDGCEIRIEIPLSEN